MDWYIGVWRKYAVFTGRARRQEYWMFFLINLGILIALGIVDAAVGTRTRAGFGVLTGIYDLAIFIPSLAVAVRRLHDTDKSGWWVLIGLVPAVGWIILLVLLALDGTHGPNRFGPDPKTGEAGWAGGAAYPGAPAAPGAPGYAPDQASAGASYGGTTAYPAGGATSYPAAPTASSYSSSPMATAYPSAPASPEAGADTGATAPQAPVTPPADATAPAASQPQAPPAQPQAGPQGPPAQPQSAGPPSGWYPDPSSRHQYRYWDGGRWTEHVSDNGAATVDPV